MKYLALFIACTLLFPGLAINGKVKPLDVIKVTVHVKNETGEPIKYAWIFAELWKGLIPLKKRGSTDEQGKCTFRWMASAGYLKIRVEAPYYFKGHLSKSIEAPGNYQFNITLYHAPPLDEIPKASIEGRVSFVLLNIPIKGAIVETYPVLSSVECYVPEGGGTKTREDGKFPPLPVLCLNTLRLEDGRIVYDYNRSTKCVVEVAIYNLVWRRTIEVYPNETIWLDIHVFSLLWLLIYILSRDT